MTDAADGVLLIHAFPLDAGMWAEQVDALAADGWRVAAPSLPGFGGAPSAGPVMSMGAAADRCVQALDAVGLQRAVVCGLSMGGYAAFELWRMARQRVAGLVLANTRAGADTNESAAARRTLAAKLREQGNGFMVAEPPPLLSRRAPPELWEQVTRTIAEQPAEAIAAAAEGMADRPDSTPDLGTIDVPTLVLTSGDDTLITPDATLAMVDHIAGAASDVLDGGHLSNLEQPAAFTGAVRTFLAGFSRA